MTAKPKLDSQLATRAQAAHPNPMRLRIGGWQSCPPIEFSAICEINTFAFPAQIANATALLGMALPWYRDSGFAAGNQAD
jgi:hypothetical protein